MIRSMLTGLNRSVIENAPIKIVFLFLATFVMRCDASDSCEEAKHHVEQCGWRFFSDPCNTHEGRCATRCEGQLSCEQIERLNNDEPVREFMLCFTACLKNFICEDGSAAIPQAWVCDAEEDCADGSDEDGCHYFECESSFEMISQDEVCDGYEDCADGSDEAICDERQPITE
jgi:hypothetical protein